MFCKTFEYKKFFITDRHCELCNHHYLVKVMKVKKKKKIGLVGIFSRVSMRT